MLKAAKPTFRHASARVDGKRLGEGKKRKTHLSAASRSVSCCCSRSFLSSHRLISVSSCLLASLQSNRSVLSCLGLNRSIFPSYSRDVVRVLHQDRIRQSALLLVRPAPRRLRWTSGAVLSAGRPLPLNRDSRAGKPVEKDIPQTSHYNYIHIT